MDTLILCTAEPTPFSSIHIDQLSNIGDESFKEIKVDEREKLITSGSFKDFHIYVIVTHTKFSIHPNSIRVETRFGKFSATIKLLDLEKDLELEFKIPLEFNKKKPITITAESFFQDELFDGFRFQQDGKSITVFCDLHFLIQYSTNLIEKEKIPLLVEYIGIAEKENQATQKRREASDRLGSNGHKTLQNICAKLQRTPKRNCTICLYKFKDEDFSNVLDFSNTIKTIEATLISYFKPKNNKQRLTFPSKDNLKRPESLESTIKAASITNILTFVAPPKCCSMYTQDVCKGNINSDRNKKIQCLLCKAHDNFEHAIKVDMLALSCNGYDFKP